MSKIDDEKLLNFFWSNLAQSATTLKTDTGETIVVKNSGTDTRNSSYYMGAEVAIDRTETRGSVKIFSRSSMWNDFVKNRYFDAESVVLLVVKQNDSVVISPSGKNIPVLTPVINQNIITELDTLYDIGYRVTCPALIGCFDGVVKYNILTRLAIDRLKTKSDRLHEIYLDRDQSISDTIIAGLLDCMVLGKDENRASMKLLVENINYGKIINWMEEVEDIEALLFGTAGLLSLDKTPNADDYVFMLRNRYDKIQKNFNILPVSAPNWNFSAQGNMALWIVLAQAAAIIFAHKNITDDLITCKTLDDFKVLLSTSVSKYWQNHYYPGKTEMISHDNKLSSSKSDRIIINLFLPFIIFYNKIRPGTTVISTEDILDIMENIKPESNHYVTHWGKKMSITNVLMSQAVIELSKNFCEKKQCYSCPIGKKQILLHTHKDI